MGGGLLLMSAVDVTGDEEGDLSDLLVKRQEDGGVSAGGRGGICNGSAKQKAMKLTANISTAVLLMSVYCKHRARSA